mgnify:CR=1 FL=1
MTTETTRQEHLKWCKERAAEYLNRNDWKNAWASFASDMSKHAETKDHSALGLGTQMLFAGLNNNVPDMCRFIEGFN